MKTQRTECRRTHDVALLTSAVLLLAGCLLAGTLLADPAWAGEIQAVAGDEIQPENGLLINSGPETKACEPIVLETSPNVSKESINIDAGNTPDLCFTFNDLTTEGQTGYVVVKHPIAGTMQAPNGEKINVGACVRYEVVYSRANDGLELGDKAQLKVHASLGMSVAQLNIVKTHATYSFFDAQTEQPINFDTGSMYYSVSSLNGSPLAEYVEIQEETYEKALIKQDGNITVGTRGANTIFQGTTDHPDDPGWNKNYDQYGNPYYNNNTVMVYPKNGVIDFWAGDEAEGYALMWWQISSAPIGHAQSSPPSKTVSTENAHEGDTLTYSVVQKIGEYGINELIPYTNLSLVDHLPENVAYTQGSARLVIDGNEADDLTESAGQATYDAASHTLTYAFNADYLRNTFMYGQSYRLSFDCVVTGSPLGSSHLKNKPYTYFNNSELQGNEVDTLVQNAALAIDKQVSRETWNVGDLVDYQVTVTNTAPDSVAHNVVVSDLSLPEGLAVVDAADIEVQDVPETVSCPVQVNGTVSMEEQSNSYTIEPEGTGWKIAIDYLAADAPVTITYHAKATADVANRKVTNTATAVADNAQEVQDSANVLILDDLPLKQGYEVTAYKSADPASGSLVEPGSTITYTLEARNTGNETAAYTFIRDYIPAGTTYVEGSVNHGGCYVAQGNYVEWVIETIEPECSERVAYQVTVQDEPPALIANTALYGSAETNPGTAGSISTDPPHQTNEVMHSTDEDIAVPALLDLEKTCDPKAGSTVTEGSIIRYTLTLRNNGGQDASQLCIRDYIPFGTTYVEGSASESGVFDADGNCITWTPESLGAGESLAVEFSVRVQPGVSQNAVLNQALFQNNWDGTEDPVNSSNIVSHRFSPTPEVPTLPSNGERTPLGSIASGMAKTGDFIMKNIAAIFCAIASVSVVVLWRKRMETKKTGYARYGKAN